MVDLKEIYVQVNNLERNKRLIPPSLEHHHYLCMFNFLFNTFSLFLSHTSNIFPLYTHTFYFYFLIHVPQSFLGAPCPPKSGFAFDQWKWREILLTIPLIIMNGWTSTQWKFTITDVFRPHLDQNFQDFGWGGHHNWSEGFLLFSPRLIMMLLCLW